MGTLIANKFTPGLLDRYLALTGYKSQQTDQPRPAGQPANLWGARRRDSGRTSASRHFRRQVDQPQLSMWASQHHGVLGGVVGALRRGGRTTRRMMRR